MSQKGEDRSIFLPGFSTAQKITTVSGRGVGMDVVKHNVVGSTARSKSRPRPKPRHGLPLEDSADPGHRPRADRGQRWKWRYVIPQVSLLAVVSLVAEYSERGIERVHKPTGVSLWRGRLLPLVDLWPPWGAGRSLSGRR